MMVYVLETGCYEDRGIQGVYRTPELAMAAWPIHAGMSLVSGIALKDVHWEKEEDEEDGDSWSLYGADWSDAASITEYELE